MTWWCRASEDEDSGDRWQEVGCIVSLCLVVIFNANSFFLATGRKSRIVEIGRQQSVDWREECVARAVESMNTECGAHR